MLWRHNSRNFIENTLLGEKKMDKIVTILCVVISLAFSSSANATPLGTVDIEHDGFGAKGTLQVWGGGHTGTSVYGGVYMLDKSYGTGEGDFWPDDELIGGFCVELNEYVPQTATKYDVVMPEKAYNDYLDSLIGITKANYLRELWGRFHDPKWADHGPYTSNQNREAEAFAAAVWEIIYEDLPTSSLGWDVTTDGSSGSSGFRAVSVDSNLANSWLHALTGDGPQADLRIFATKGSQDYLVEVPEPVTIALFGIGGVISLLRRRRTSS
jgi:hypothetical protein